MTDSHSAEGEPPEEPLPFECEYEVGVEDADNADDWEWYHPREKSEGDARKAAMDAAKQDGMERPTVYEVYGPVRPDNPTTVGEEVIEQVFD